MGSAWSRARSAREAAAPLNRWSERNIAPGATTDQEIERHLSQARIIVLVVTANFLADDHCQDLLRRALACRQAGQAEVIPVIADFCLWDMTPLGQLNPLPDRNRPVKDFANRNEAWNKIVRGILQVANPPAGQAPVAVPPSQPPSVPSAPASVRGQKPSRRAKAAKAPKFHAALLTAIDREREMVFEALRQQGHKPERYNVDGRVFHTFTLPPPRPEGQPVRALVAQSVDKGGLAAQALVQDIVHKLHPQLLLLVGVCGGFKGRIEEQDVLVARNLFYYEPARLVPGKVELRPAPYRGSAAVIELVRALHVEGELAAALEGASLHVKDYATDEKVIADAEAPLRHVLHELSADIYGFEMEGAGMLHALWELAPTEHVQAGIIKAVSDRGDAGMAKDKDERQRRAALRAARIAIELLRHFSYSR